MHRIVNAEAAAMQLPLARLLAEIDAPGAPPIRAIAEGGRSAGGSDGGRGE
jgi:hypothetical protein